MSDFSDAQDRKLVNLVCVYERRGLKIAWSEIANKMRGMSSKKLANRLKTLQNRHGKRVSHFPAWYFVKSHKLPKKMDSKSNKSSIPVLVSVQDKVPPADFRNLLTKFNSLFDHGELVTSDRTKLLLTAAESHEAIRTIFQSVLLADVRQKSGKSELNVGEVTPDSVTELIRLCGISSSDVFVDIGSGVGNIVAQVALETTAKGALGIEIRVPLATCSKQQLDFFSSKYPRLRAVQIYAQDIVDADITLWQNTTIIYCHNTLFQSSTQLFVEQLCCTIPHLKIVILQNPFCNRHRMGCTREFCTIFRREDTKNLNVSFKSSVVPFHIYFKR